MNRSGCLVLLVATVLGALLRFHHLSDPSLWNDELFTVRDALRLDAVGPMKTFSYVPTRIAFELYGLDAEQAARVGAPGWRALGLDEFRIRVASCAVGVLSVLLLGLAGRLLCSAWAAGCLALLLAFAPWHLEWSQNARFYIQLFLFYNLALVLYWGGTQRRSLPLLAGALLAALAAPLTHAPAMVIFGVFGIDLLYQAARERRLPIGAPGLALLAVAAGTVLAIAARAFGQLAFVSSLARPPDLSPFRFAFDVFLTLGAPLVVLALVGAWTLWQSDRRLAVYLCAGAILPVACFCLLSLITFVATRYVFVSLYAWLALAAIGGETLYRALRERLGLLPALAPLLAVFASMAITHSEYFGGGYGYRARYRHAFRYVAERRSPGDVVFSTNVPGAQYYLQDASVSGDPLYEDFAGLAAIDAPVWLVVSSSAYEQGAGRPHPLDALASLRAVFATRVRYPQTTLRVYYRPGRGASAAPPS